MDGRLHLESSIEMTSVPRYDVVVVVVSWNVRNLLQQCLESLLNDSRTLRIRAVVVDNASSDHSASMVRQLFPSVDLIACEENLGFARANNLALRRYRGQSEYFLLLNPDTIVHPGTLVAMRDFMGANSDAGCAGCKVLLPDGQLDLACKRGELTPSSLFRRAVGIDGIVRSKDPLGDYHLTHLSDDEIHQVGSVVGAFMFIRHSCLDQVGLLDESVFMYGEDIEWCYRARAANWKVYYVPTTTITHYKGQSSKKASFRMIWHWYGGAWWLYRKHIAPKHSFLLNVLVWLGFQFKIGASLVRNAFRRKRRVPSRVVA